MFRCFNNDEEFNFNINLFLCCILGTIFSFTGRFADLNRLSVLFRPRAIDFQHTGIIDIRPTFTKLSDGYDSGLPIKKNPKGMRAVCANLKWRA